MKSYFYSMQLCLLFFLFAGNIFPQIPDKKKEKQEEQTTLPTRIDFSKIFQQQKMEMTREEFDTWKNQRERQLYDKLTEPEALEKAIHPEEYLVGPGDIFSFNIWGALEKHFYLPVLPEGMLLIPSVGEIEAANKTLKQVQEIVKEKAKGSYENCEVGISLAALRNFRVHVAGEVAFPGTFIARAVDRVSEMIVEAGGVTERAWKGGIVIRHADSTKDVFNLSKFEMDGDIEKDIYVQGGDIIHVPSVDLTKQYVYIEKDQEYAGVYQITPNEKLLNFITRIRALKRNTDLSKIVVERNSQNGTKYISPFINPDSLSFDFILRSGDHVILPSHYVYVKGAVRNPGAYPYVFNLTAKEYAGMAGGDFRAGKIKEVSVYHVRTGKTEKGPDIIVEAGDVVNLPETFNLRLQNWVRIIPAITSLILAAKAAGVFGE
ncbi:MAG: SLBB domain-containing protein [bacterium]